MSRAKQARRPAVELMEDRVVLSSATTPLVVQDARLVQQAFATFQATYKSDVQTILYGPGQDGSINPGANRPAFDAAVASAIGTLSTTIGSDVANLPSATTLNTTVQSELLGTGGNTLQGQLAAIPTPGGVSTLSSRLFSAESLVSVRLTAGEVNRQVRTSTPPPTTGTPSTGGTLTASQLGQDLNAARSAFSTFKAAYNNDVKTILYGAADDGSINPTTNRAAFDAQVSSDLSTLNSSVTAALSTIPNNTTLLAEANTAILGPGTNSLQSALRGLATPTGVQTTSARAFTIDSALAIGSTELMLAADVVQTAGPEVSKS